MKVLVNIRKPARRIFKESYFVPLVFCILGAGMIYFSQSNFDEDKVNQAVVSASLMSKKAISLLQKSKTKDPQRPKRRPFSLD